MAPALQQAVDAGIPVVTIDRRVDNVPGHPRPCRRRQREGRRGAGQPHRGAVPRRRHHHQPAGHARRQPGDRPQQGPAQRARRGWRQVQDRLRADRRTSPRRGPVGDRSRRSPAWTTPPDVIVAANDDMALGAIEAVKAPQPIEGVVDHRLRRAARGAGRGARRRPDRDRRAVPRRPEPRRGAGAGRASCATAPKPRDSSSC